MSWNLQYEQIGKTFVQQYYACFDDPSRRPGLAVFYNSLTFQKIAHSVTSADSQPMFDGGILICVLGQLKTDEDHPHTFHQTFVLKGLADSFYIEHDVFRLSLHHIG
ncbi:nuclear transport factor 2 [Caerostris extrusa]|uniref:Nuclear transport factor 2 n=1 Tax=Caerostris extrusa TaxID=172846 RepID=A0AAV4MUE5_CAEEX|nr:nuclear transport factor 2 [Caerostris extrusa]